MEYEKIKQLIEDMGNSKITSLDIEFPDGMKVKMEKSTEKVVATEKIEAPREYVEVVKTEEKPEEKVVEGNIIKSPMIGTFYSKPSPDSMPYVEVGTVVKKGTVLCIVEAMKLMNEIKAEHSGKVTQICVKNGDPVEFGQVLMYVE